MSAALPWRAAGSYFEACNCEAVCPCRSLGGRLGGGSTHGVCQFALSWWILDGRAAAVDLSGRKVVLAGWYDDDEPGSPWRIVLYLDEGAGSGQREALTEIFLGRAGGTAFRNLGRHFGEIIAVRTAKIDLDHEPGRQQIRAGDYVTVTGAAPVEPGESVSCGIPGHDHPGQEVTTELQRVEDGPLSWEFRGRCGFATDFAYSSE